MKKTSISPTIIILFIVSILYLGACAPSQILSVPNPASRIEGVTDGDGSNGILQNDPAASSNTGSKDGMVAFDGSVFVASAQLVNERWKAAGWLISREPVDTDTQQISADCTLYPHQGVEDQWVGLCNGYVLVPKDGASHISVMHTAQDGTTTMIQIAPPSVNTNP
jgi:hypothetical protein